MATDKDFASFDHLTPDQLRILRDAGTEPAFSGQLLYNKKTGVYRCAACGNELFHSTHKFDSGSGWPSFYDVAQYGAVELGSDDSHGMQRVEVRCQQCGGHLGHVFDDAFDQPTGQRYCINSLALDFAESADEEEGS